MENYISVKTTKGIRKMRIKIAFVQLLPGIDLDENLDIVRRNRFLCG